MFQFIKSRSLIVTDTAIRSTSIGSKDSQATLHSVWSTLLVPLAAKIRRKQLGSSGGGVDDGKYVDRVTSAISSCGDIDRLNQGAFEQYPQLKPLDASWNNLCKLLDGPLTFYDTLHKKTNGEGEYEVMGYMSYAVAGWYTHMAAPANAVRAVEWPKADYEVSRWYFHHGERASSYWICYRL